MQKLGWSYRLKDQRRVSLNWRMASANANTGTQVGVSSSRHITTRRTPPPPPPSSRPPSRPQQDTGPQEEDEIPIIKTVEDENAALNELQTAGFRIIQGGDRDSIIELSDIIILALLENKYPSDNNDVNWERDIEPFVKCFRRVVDLRIDPDKTRPVLRRLRLNIANIFRGCVVCLLNMKSYEEKCRFILGVLVGDYVKQLQNAYFDEQFFEKVKSLPVDFAPDGCILSAEQRATISEFFQLILEKLTITVWLELDQMRSLLNEPCESKSASTIKATITLTSMTAKVEEVSHFSPVLQPSVNKLKRSRHKTNDSDLCSVSSISEDGEESATVVIVRNTVTELIQKYFGFVDKVLASGKHLMEEVEQGESFDDDYLESPMTENVEVELAGNSEKDIDVVLDTGNIDDLRSMVTELIGENKRYKSQLKVINNPAYKSRIKRISTLGEQITSNGTQISTEMVQTVYSESEEDKDKDRIRLRAHSIKLRAHGLKKLCEELDITTTELMMSYQKFTKRTKLSDHPRDHPRDHLSDQPRDHV